MESDELGLTISFDVDELGSIGTLDAVTVGADFFPFSQSFPGCYRGVGICCGLSESDIKDYPIYRWPFVFSSPQQ